MSRVDASFVSQYNTLVTPKTSSSILVGGGDKGVTLFSFSVSVGAPSIFIVTTSSLMSKKGSMNKKIYITCVLSILYASIYRLRPYFTQRYTPLINEASITITKNKPVYAEYDDGDKTYIIEDNTIEIKDEAVEEEHHISEEEIISSSDNSIYIKNKEPYLNRFQRRFASSKERGKKGGYLFLRHMRKAGGTTLRVYFHDALLHHNITRSTDDFRSYKSLTKEQMEKRLAKTQKNEEEAIVDPNHYQVHYIEHEFLPIDWKCPSIDPRWKESLRVIVLRIRLKDIYLNTSSVEYQCMEKSRLLL